MQVVFHLGAHCTDEDRLVRSLGKNRAALAERGVVVPAPWRYRPVFREMQAVLRGQPARPDVQETLLDAVMDEDRAERLIFSNALFLCVPQRVVSEGEFYGIAQRKLQALANLFPGSECEFHLGLRNPATLIPAVLESTPGLAYEGLMNGADPLSLRWAPVIARCVAENPGKPLVVWSNEDTPLLWPDILRRVAGVEDSFPIDGEADVIATILRPDASARLTAALASAAPDSADPRGVRSAALEALLAEFARPEALDMEVTLPGWSMEVLAAMTTAYEDDIAEIRDMPGVEFLEP